MKTSHTNGLQKLVRVYMSPGHPAMNNEEIENWITQLPVITENIVETMNNAVFGSFSDKLIRRHLNQIRKECTVMLDALYSYPDQVDRMEKLYQTVLNCLLYILEVQQLQYAEYLDANRVMPILLYREAAQKIEAKTIPMVTAMGRYNADKKLQAVVVSKMTGLLKKGSGSWHQIHYLEALQIAVMELCVGLPVNISAQLRSMLLRRNFNTSGFIAYCKTGIEQEIAEKYEMHDAYDCLYQYQLEFNSLPCRHKLDRFDPGRAKLKEELLQYVNSRLNIMNKRNLLTVDNPVVNPTMTRYRLPISISVDVLAYLFRLLFMAGVITGIRSELLLFISRNFKTPGVGEADLSLKSLNNKYRQVVNNTAITVRSILVKMLKQLNDEFG